MDASDERLEKRLRALGEVIDQAVGDARPGTWERLRAAMRSRHASGRRRAGRTGWWLAAAAVVAALLVLSPAVLRHLQTPPKRPLASPGPRVGVGTPVGLGTPGGLGTPVGLGAVTAVDFLTEKL